MQVRVHVLGPVAKLWKMLISDEPSAWRCMMMMILLLFLLKQNLVLAACPHQKNINAGVALPSPALARVASRLEKTGSRETSEDINPDPGDVQMTTTLKSMTAQRA